MTAIYLDITRLSDAVDQPTPTGIDRVELEYAKHLLGARQNFVWNHRGRLHQVPNWLVSELVGTLSQVWSDGEADRNSLKSALALFQQNATRLALPSRTERFLTRMAALDWGARWQALTQERAEIAQFVRPMPLWLALPVLQVAPRLIDRVLQASAARKPVHLHRQISGPAIYLNVSHLKLNSFALRRCLARWDGVHVLAYIHDLMPISDPALFQKRTRRIHTRRMKNLERMGAKLLVNSQFTRDEVARHYPGLEVLEVLEIGVSAPYLAPPARPAVPSGFVAVGTLEPRKNYLWLAQNWLAFCAANHEAKDDCLTIFGKRGWIDPDEYRALKALSGPSLEIVEGASDKEIKKRLAEARALVSAAHVEGWGMPLAEAHALGTPVIATDIAAHREVTRGVADFYPVGDVQAFHSHLKAALSGNSAHKLPNPWSWDAHFEKFRAAISQANRLD